MTQEVPVVFLSTFYLIVTKRSTIILTEDMYHFLYGKNKFEKYRESH